MAKAPFLLGDNKAATGAATLTITTSTASPQGSIIAVYTGWGTQSGGTPTVTGVADNSGNSNTYTNTTANPVTNGNSQWWYSLSQGGLPSGDVITITYTSGANLPSAMIGIAVSVPGVNYGNALDVNVIGGANSTTYSLSSGTLSQANEVLLQACTDPDGSATTNTMAAPWTSIVSSFSSAGSAGLTLIGALGYDLVTATTAVTGKTTTSSAGDLTASVISFRLTSLPVATPSLQDAAGNICTTGQAINTAALW